MKQIFTTLLLLTVFTAFSQKQPPGLIYSCEKKINDTVQYYIFNSSGKKILDHSVDWAYSNTWSWLFVLNRKNKLRTVYNYYGQKLGIDSIQDSQSTSVNLNRVGLKRNGKWGFYDKQGKIIIQHIYDNISYFQNNIAAVKQGQDIFMIDTNGVKLTTPYISGDKNYSFAKEETLIGIDSDFYHKDFKKIYENEKVGLLDVKNNKIIIPVEYDDLIDIEDDFKIITGKKNGKYGLIAFGGHIIIPLEYERIFVLNNYF